MAAGSVLVYLGNTLDGDGSLHRTAPCLAELLRCSGRLMPWIGPRPLSAGSSNKIYRLVAQALESLWFKKYCWRFRVWFITRVIICSAVILGLIKSQDVIFPEVSRAINASRLRRADISRKTLKNMTPTVPGVGPSSPIN